MSNWIFALLGLYLIGLDCLLNLNVFWLIENKTSRIDTEREGGREIGSVSPEQRGVDVWCMLLGNLTRHWWLHAVIAMHIVCTANLPPCCIQNRLQRNMRACLSVDGYGCGCVCVSVCKSICLCSTLWIITILKCWNVTTLLCGISLRGHNSIPRLQNLETNFKWCVYIAGVACVAHNKNSLENFSHWFCQWHI